MRPSPVRVLSLFLAFSFLSFPPLAGAAQPPSGPPLLVVWPPEGVTVAAPRIRVGGRTDPAATVTVNGKRLRVYPTGAFAGTCPLRPGENKIVFRAAGKGGDTVAVRTVMRRKPLRTLPKTPLRFDPDFEGEPSEDRIVRPGDVIRIAVKGSPGCRATFRIGSGRTHYPLFPTSRDGVGGFYEGVYQVRPTDRFVRARVTCYLEASGGKTTVRRLMPARITVAARPFPDVARVKDDYVRLRAEPWSGAPLADAPRGAYLNIDGRIGRRLRVALTPWLHGWLDRDAVEMETGVPPLRRGYVRDLSVDERDGATILRVPLGVRVPFVVTERLHPPTLDLTVFGVDNRLNWVTDRATSAGMIESVVPIPSGDGVCKLRVSVRGGIAGYRGYYEGDTLCLAVRPSFAPPADRSRPLAGRTIILDPGHGGQSKGTIGSTGLEEKTINLDLCRILRRKLEAMGATVRLTRDGDVDVSLADRARLAEQGGDLFVSIHNNSIALTGDPLGARGVGVYYYHPHSRDLAYAVFGRMLRVEPRPRPYGVVKADLFVVREITSMPSVLVECLFLSHPADEMLLLDKRFDERYMEAVAEGIADWFTEGTGAAGPESPRARSGG